jgi:hypothetical protein
MRISFFKALDAWGQEAKRDMDDFDKLRLWIKWAARVTTPGDWEATQKFTAKVEREVFGC